VFTRRRTTVDRYYAHPTATGRWAGGRTDNWAVSSSPRTLPDVGYLKALPAPTPRATSPPDGRCSATTFLPPPLLPHLLPRRAAVLAFGHARRFTTGSPAAPFLPPRHHPTRTSALRCFTHTNTVLGPTFYSGGHAVCAYSLPYTRGADRFRCSSVVGRARRLAPHDCWRLPDVHSHLPPDNVPHPVQAWLKTFRFGIPCLVRSLNTTTTHHELVAVWGGENNSVPLFSGVSPVRTRLFDGLELHVRTVAFGDLLERHHHQLAACMT